MSEPPPDAPLDSLATKIILFVFLSTFATALVVSWISIQSTHAYLRHDSTDAIPRPSRARPRSWTAGSSSRGRASGELSELERAELTSLLAAERPDPHSWLLLTDGEGRVLAASPRR